MKKTKILVVLGALLAMSLSACGGGKKEEHTYQGAVPEGLKVRLAQALSEEKRYNNKSDGKPETDREERSHASHRDLAK